jgi:hypothetical protein
MMKSPPSSQRDSQGKVPPAKAGILRRKPAKRHLPRQSLNWQEHLTAIIETKVILEPRGLSLLEHRTSNAANRTLIRNLQDKDVIKGLGWGVARHPGNIQFREVCRQLQAEFEEGYVPIYTSFFPTGEGVDEAYRRRNG